MAIQSASGLTLYVGASGAGASTKAEFEAVTWTIVKHVESIGDFGDSFSPIIFQGLEGRSKKLKGSVDGGNFALLYAFDSACTGQSLILFYHAYKIAMPIKILFPAGDIRYFNGHLFSIKESVESADSILMVNTNVGVAGPIIRVT